MRYIQDDQFADHGQQCDQDDGADLNNAVAPLSEHQERALEFERDDHREDHAEHGLENLVFCRVERVGINAEQNIERQVPEREDDDDGNQADEY